MRVKNELGFLIMKRLRKLCITILLICCSLLVLAGCKEDRVAQSIALKGYSAQTPLETSIGRFSYDGYIVVITYNNGDTQELPLTEEMISETDQLKFYQEGDSEIDITYQGVTASVRIRVARNVFPSSVKLKGVTTVYTGKSITVEVEGDIPGGTNIFYPQGNEFQDAGVYDMTAVLQCDGYETKTLSAVVEIQKADYDISNAQLYDESFEYDKESHGLVVKGKVMQDENGRIFHDVATLPQGVSVRYTLTKVKDGKGNDIPLNKQQVVEGNKAVDAGTYRICAQFKGDAGNYNPIPDSTATLTITRATYDMKNVEFADTAVTYTGKAQALSIAKDSKLPMDVSVSYEIKQEKNGLGEAVTDTYKKGNSATDAGVYSVLAYFTVIGKNADNYQTNPTVKEARLTIERAVYDLSGVEFYDTTVRYTGVAYELKITDKLPEEIGVSYKIEQVKNGAGQKVTGADKYQANTSVATNAGEYLVTAVFDILDQEIKKNYTTNPLEKQVTLTILRASYDQALDELTIESYQFTQTSEGTYTLLWDVELPEGVTPCFTLTGKDEKTLKGVVSVVETDGKTTYQCVFTITEAGAYTCVVSFTHNNDNYEACEKTLETQVVIDSPTV